MKLRTLLILSVHQTSPVRDWKHGETGKNTFCLPPKPSLTGYQILPRQNLRVCHLHRNSKTIQNDFVVLLLFMAGQTIKLCFCLSGNVFSCGDNKNSMLLCSISAGTDLLNHLWFYLQLHISGSSLSTQNRCCHFHIFGSLLSNCTHYMFSQFGVFFCCSHIREAFFFLISYLLYEATHESHKGKNNKAKSKQP